MLRIILVLAAAAFAEAVKPPLAAPGGRYVFGQTSEFRRDQFMLDTQTGRLWQITMTSDSLLVLQAITYESLDVKGSEVYKVVTDLPPKAEAVSFPLPKPTPRIPTSPINDLLPDKKK